MPEIISRSVTHHGSGLAVAYEPAPRTPQIGLRSQFPLRHPSPLQAPALVERPVMASMHDVSSPCKALSTIMRQAGFGNPLGPQRASAIRARLLSGKPRTENEQLTHGSLSSVLHILTQSTGN
jgi:hypothetical protein